MTTNTAHPVSSLKRGKTVAQSAARGTGLEPALLKRMVTMLAMLAVDYLSKQTGGLAGQATQSGQAGGIGGMLGQALGRFTSNQPAAQNSVGPGSMLGS